MKTYTLKFAEKLPSGKLSHFAELIKEGEKIHTIREDSEKWSQRVHEVQEGKATIELITDDGEVIRTLTKLDNIGIEDFEMRRFFIGLDMKSDGVYFSSEQWNALIKNDGLKNNADFIKIFFSKGIEVFKGCIIHFTNFRYNN